LNLCPLWTDNLICHLTSSLIMSLLFTERTRHVVSKNNMLYFNFFVEQLNLIYVKPFDQDNP